MAKGVNTVFVEARNEIVGAVNKALQSGLPVSMVDGILETVVMSVKNLLNEAVRMEAEQERAEAEASNSENTEPVEA